MSNPTEPTDHAPAVPGDWGVDTDPETTDDSFGANVEGDPVDIAEPASADEDGDR